MNRKAIRQYEMLVRVRDFGAARADLFPATSLAGQAFAGVNAAVTRLGEHAVSQMSARPQSGRTTPTARQALLRALEAIVRTARAIKAADPAFDNKFHLPRRQPSQALLAVARSFVREGGPLAERFAANEMPKTVFDDLNGLAAAVELAIRERDDRKDERTAARVHFETALASGLDALRQLDVQVPNRLKDDPATLAVWARDRRVDYPFRRKVRPATPVAPPVATARADELPPSDAPAQEVPDDQAA